MLTDYSWPGNVRELVNVVERAVLLSTHGLITPEVLPPGVADEPGAEAQAVAESAALSDVIQRHVLQVLERTGATAREAARILGISRRTLHRMAQRLKDSKTDQWDNLSRDGTI